MKSNWSKEELTIALYWYCTKIEFTKIKYTKPEVEELADIVNRTPSAAAFKLVNFARLDPSLKARGVKGMSKGSKAEIPVWEEFYNNWDNLALTAEKLIAERKNIKIEEVSNIETADLPRSGKERKALVKVRINQCFFRRSVLLSYKSKCCITGLNIPELLVASHIKPWAKDLSQAANPENGLCLNALHDKAFDNGLITVSEDYKIILSKKLFKSKDKDFVEEFFVPFRGKEIIKPARFLPHKDFLQYHRKNIFKD